MMNRLKEKYKKEIIPALMKKFKYKNIMQVPSLEKVVISMGVGEAISNSKVMDNALSDLSLISGQKPIITKAKKSIASFKLRQGMSIGCKVTLRGERMYIFLDKLFNIVLPRIRDFRGLSSKAFDGKGNYSIGLKEQIIFPEIEYDKIDKTRGMNINIITS
ncbi:MAG: 50S ribosomal protein L5, partial [Armatimonadetes bacterium]|nr:50S ribosomal protein L5 [Armatimonadota bacterium]